MLNISKEELNVIAVLIREHSLLQCGHDSIHIVVVMYYHLIFHLVLYSNLPGGTGG